MCVCVCVCVTETVRDSEIVSVRVRERTSDSAANRVGNGQSAGTREALFATLVCELIQQRQTARELAHIRAKLGNFCLGYGERAAAVKPRRFPKSGMLRPHARLVTHEPISNDQLNVSIYSNSQEPSSTGWGPGR